jgi:hypothetical protein
VSTANNCKRRTKISSTGLFGKDSSRRCLSQ